MVDGLGRVEYLSKRGIRDGDLSGDGKRGRDFDVADEKIERRVAVVVCES